jgi:hypothetical protein
MIRLSARSVASSSSKSVPLAADEAERVVAALRPLAFDRLYGWTPERVLHGDAKYWPGQAPVLGRPELKVLLGGGMQSATFSTGKEAHMLGEKVGETTGKIIAQRVLAQEESGAAGPRIEVSVQESGTLLGLETTGLLSYWSVLREGGVLYGEGRGVSMSKDGETCSWRGAGIGKATGRGMAASYRGSLYYEAKGPRLSRLNGTCVVFEYQVDENGNTKSQMFEWK